jgi:hypothetical protein
MNWSKICTLKNLVVLGVRNMLQFNQALLDKWLWRFATERDALWRKLVDIKYYSTRGCWCRGTIWGWCGLVWRVICSLR